MRIAHVTALVSVLCALVGVSMLAPMGISLIYGEALWRVFGLCAVFSVIGGGGLFLLLRDRRGREINHREGAAVVAFSWIAASLIGGLPLYLSPDFTTYTDAVFEAASGFTTTGASILTDVEACTRGVLFWRALTHWLGGMGFIVLSIAILPYLGVGGLELYKNEVPSPVVDRLEPRIRDTATVMWKIYVALTAIEIVLLLAGGMNLFDSVCHSFATLATGGFSTRNASIGAYKSAYIEWVVGVFMILAGINFSLHFYAVRRRFRLVWRDDEWRFYMTLVLGATAIITAILYLKNGKAFSQALVLGFFQVATLITTTGFASEDYSSWHTGAMGILVFLLFVGGCAGSTGGGPKCLRVLLLLRQSWCEFLRILHPRVVTPVKLGGRAVEESVLATVWAFMGLYLATYFVTSLALAVLGEDLPTAFTAAIACLGNIGPGFADVGPTGNYAAIPTAGKWILSAAMIIGRLEVYTVLVLLLREFWRK